MGKIHSQLLTEIEQFLEETGMGPTYFGKAAGTTSDIVKRLRDGGRVWPETAEKARAFMSERRRHAKKHGDSTPSVQDNVTERAGG